MLAFDLAQAGSVDADLESRIVLAILSVRSVAREFFILLPPRRFSRGSRSVQSLAAVSYELNEGLKLDHLEVRLKLRERLLKLLQCSLVALSLIRLRLELTELDRLAADLVTVPSESVCFELFVARQCRLLSLQLLTDRINTSTDNSPVS